MGLVPCYSPSGFAPEEKKSNSSFSGSTIFRGKDAHDRTITKRTHELLLDLAHDETLVHATLSDPVGVLECIHAGFLICSYVLRLAFGLRSNLT